MDGVELETAILIAIRSLFKFTHRAADSKALWSDAQVVWLGRSTFLHWCLEDAEFDIPWIVARARNAPRDRNRLREIVHARVVDYFASQLDKLPRRQTGNWLPLP